jgi:beta-ureidopropionase / N-carbamoyl-L-amino-acid hydrolase
MNAEFRGLADRDTVWNFGNMVFRPGAANVVPGEGEMLLEFRDINVETLDRLEACVLTLVAEANRGPVGVEIETTARIPPTALAANLSDAIAAAARARGEEPVRLPSGAGHDVMVVARYMPAAMLFVPSIGGISHDVRENTSDADIVFGCEVMADAVAEISRQI